MNKGLIDSWDGKDKEVLKQRIREKRIRLENRIVSPNLDYIRGYYSALLDFEIGLLGDEVGE